MSRRRRGRGEGAIYPRSDGTWCASVSLGHEQGRRKRRTVYGQTKLQVQEKLRAVQHDATSGLLTDVSRMTMKEYLLHWLENAHRPKVQSTTYHGNEPKVRLKLIPHLGQVKL